MQDSASLRMRLEHDGCSAKPIADGLTVHMLIEGGIQIGEARKGE